MGNSWKQDEDIVCSSMKVLVNIKVDGDQLYLASIKEACSVIDLMSIHPMTTLLGGTGTALSNMVHCSDEMSIALHGYFTDEGKLDIESYRLAIQGKKAAA